MNATRFIATILGLCLGVAAIAQEPAEDAGIPAQPLNKALEEFADKSGLQIIYVAELAEGKNTAGARPNLTETETLAQLLASTGLEYEFLNANTVTVQAVHDEAEDPGNSRATPGPVMMAQASERRQAQTSVERNQTSREPETDSDKDEKRQPLEEIVVTGSRIRRQPGDSIVPVITIDRAEITRLGAGTINDVLRYLPQAAFVSDETGFALFAGQTTINLRGLGVGTTLVLLNGRRLGATGHTSGTFVDLNTIPVKLVERIEVLADGASAVYGADALGGVMNIILRKDVTGLELQARYAFIDDSDETSVSVGYGGSVGSFRGAVVLEAYQRDALLPEDRTRTSLGDLTAFGGFDWRSTFTNPGNIYSLTGDPLPGLTSSFAGVPAGSSGVGLTPADFAATDGVLNRGFFSVNLLPESDRYGLTGYFDYDFDGPLSVFGELSVMRLETLNQISPDVLFGGSAGFFTVSADNPFNPFGETVGVDYRFTGVGPRMDDIESTSARALAGVRGTIFDEWEWEIAGLYFQDDGNRLGLNFVDFALVQAALNETDPSLALNVFEDGPGGSPELLRSLAPPGGELAETDTRQEQIDGYVSGPLAGFLNGKAQFVLGAEWRREEIDLASLISGLPATEVAGDRNITSFFGELLLPVIREGMNWGIDNLTITLAARNDDYSDFGSTFNPEFGVELRPNSSLQLRASASSSFKAPTLQDLNQARFSFSQPNVDPRRNETVIATLTSGGNPNLTAEKGDSITVGLDYQPAWADGLRFSADFWEVEVNDIIGFVGGTTILANEDLFPDRVMRAPPTPADIAAGLPGVLLGIDNSVINISSVEVSGVDLRLDYSIGTSIGEFSPTVAATYIDSYKTALLPGQPLEETVDLARQSALAGTILHWKGNVGLNWQRNDLSLGVVGRYNDSYQDSGVFGGRGDRRVKSQVLVDFHGAYEFGPHDLKLSFGVNNVLDDEPPFSNVGFFLGYDPTQGDIRGRSVYLQVNKSF